MASDAEEDAAFSNNRWSTRAARIEPSGLLRKRVTAEFVALPRKP
jgi:hypothetical protein